MLSAKRLIQVGSSLSADGVHPELQLSLYQNAYRTGPEHFRLLASLAKNSGGFVRGNRASRGKCVTQAGPRLAIKGIRVSALAHKRGRQFDHEFH